MEKITLSEGLMARMMETEAWQNISGDYPFSEVQLEKFADKVDWEQISGNRQIAWTVSMLEKFKGRLRWGDTMKYILVLYELSLPNNKDNDKISWEKYPEHSIEHILPQDDTNWPGVVNEYIIGTNSTMDPDRAQKARRILINTLGNLAVIPGGKNSSIGNVAWPVKKVKYATGSLNEQEISQKDKWGFDEIFSRGKKIIDFLMSYLEYSEPLTPEDYKTILLRDETFFIDD